MSEPELRKPASEGAGLERSRDNVLCAARPLPPDDEVLIDDLTEDEDRIFLDAILNAEPRSPRAGRRRYLRLRRAPRGNLRVAAGSRADPCGRVTAWTGRSACIWFGCPWRSGRDE